MALQILHPSSQENEESSYKTKWREAMHTCCCIQFLKYAEYISLHSFLINTKLVNGVKQYSSSCTVKLVWPSPISSCVIWNTILRGGVGSSRQENSINIISCFERDAADFYWGQNLNYLLFQNKTKKYWKIIKHDFSYLKIFVFSNYSWLYDWLRQKQKRKKMNLVWLTFSLSFLVCVFYFCFVHKLLLYWI